MFTFPRLISLSGMFLTVASLAVRGQEVPAASALSSQAILERLDRLEKQNSALLEEIKSLRAYVAQASKAPEAAAAETPPENAQSAAERQDISEHRIEEMAQTKLESSQKFPVKLTGMLLFNAFSNGAANGGQQDPVVAALDSSPRNSGASFRQTIVGFAFQGPKSLLGAQVSGTLNMDFFAGSSAPLNHIVRLRTATLKFDWTHTYFSVGQDKPLVSVREPNSLAQVGVSPLTASGNPWLWLPQFRLGQTYSFTSRIKLKAEGSVIETSESSNQPSYIVPRLEGSRPAFEARVSLRHEWGEDRAFEIAPVLHTSASHFAGSSVPSRLYGFDFFYRPISHLELSGLLFKGKNFSNLGALGGIEIGSDGLPLAVHGAGGWAQLRYIANSRLSFNLYGGQQDDRNRDLDEGRVGKNQSYNANVMYLLAPNVLSAFEFGQVRTNYLGFGTRLNNHYDLALAYLF